MDNEAHTHIISLTEEFLSALSVEYTSVEVVFEDERVIVKIFSDTDSNILIGPHGEHLHSLTLLLRRIVTKQGSLTASLFVDVNDYHSNNLERIKKEALEAAETIQAPKEEVELRPMNAFERRFVHGLFADPSPIETTSKGDGDDRRVVLQRKE